MFVFIARHAWAGERGDPRWPDDSLRELTREGIERYTQVVKLLADRGFEPEQIATSPYTRCRQTAEIIAEHVAGKPIIVEMDALEPGSDLDAMVDWTNRQADGNVCWVGHSPDVDYLTAALIGSGGAGIRFAKGAIAAIDFGGDVTVGDGELRWLVTAKVLGV